MQSQYENLNTSGQTKPEIFPSDFQSTFINAKWQADVPEELVQYVVVNGA